VGVTVEGGVGHGSIFSDETGHLMTGFSRDFASPCRKTSWTRCCHRSHRRIRAVESGQLDPHSPQAIAQLGWVQDLEGGSEPGDLTGQRLHAMPPYLELYPAIEHGGSDPDPIA